MKGRKKISKLLRILSFTRKLNITVRFRYAMMTMITQKMKRKRKAKMIVVTMDIVMDTKVQKVKSKIKERNLIKNSKHRIKTLI
jgi:hypothetical protein